MGRKAIDIKGKQYGSLTVLKKSHNKGHNLYWELIVFVIGSKINKIIIEHCKIVTKVEDRGI